MDFRQFEYLSALDERRSFTIAADSLFITRNTLVYFLSKMEAEIGAELFYRTKQGLLPTEIGKCYIEMANKVLNERRYCRQKVAEKFDTMHSSLRVGTIETFANSLLPHVAIEFGKEFPRVSFSTILYLEDHLICEDVQSGKLDIALTNQYTDVLRSSYSEVLVFDAPLTCPMLLVVPKDFPLPPDLQENSAQPVDIRRFYGEQFFAPHYSIMPDLFDAFGIPPKVQRPPTALAAFEYIKSGVGVGLITPLSIPEPDAVRCFHIKAKKPFRSTNYVIHRKDYVPSKESQAFIRLRKQQWQKDYGWADELLKKD